MALNPQEDNEVVRINHNLPGELPLGDLIRQVMEKCSQSFSGDMVKDDKVLVDAYLAQGKLCVDLKYVDTFMAILGILDACLPAEHYECVIRR